MARFTVEFPDSLNAVLEKLAKEEQTNKREIIRRALALFNYLHEQGVRTGSDRKVSVTDKDNTILTDILF